MLVLVDYSHQAYILSCNDTDYSFFGSLNYQQTGVHVEGIAGHNKWPRPKFLPLDYGLTHLSVREFSTFTKLSVLLFFFYDLRVLE